jgi:hypothetical protein
MAQVLCCTTPVRTFNPLAGITSRNKLPDSKSHALHMKSVGKLNYAFSVAKCPSNVGTYLIIARLVGKTVSSRGICGYSCYVVQYALLYSTVCTVVQYSVNCYTVQCLLLYSTVCIVVQCSVYCCTVQCVLLYSTACYFVP